jgi:flagellar basal body rod protein FlgG
MLCLKTVNNDGQLVRTIGEVIIPYDEEKIQRDTKWFSIDTIRVAMNLYRKLGLIYEQENGSLRISNFEKMIGSQTISALKKQIQLENKGGKKVEKIPPDIDIYIDKEKDKDINNLNNNKLTNN